MSSVTAPAAVGDRSGGLSATIQEGIAAARAGDRLGTVRIALQQVGFGLIPLIVLCALLASVLASHSEAVDFRNAYYVAAHRLLHGANPYAWSPAQLRAGIAFVYPAFSALAFTPFALLSKTTASVIFTLICVALAPLSLSVLGVRDWRIYGITLIWLPVFGAWQTANETILLVLATALVWRHRERPLVAGVITAAAISLKPFVWPLALWLLATRRWRAAGVAAVAGLTINLLSWWLLGFGNIATFLHDSALDASFAWRAGYSIVAAAGHLGLGRGAGEILMVLSALALALAVLHAGLVQADQRRALILAVALMLAASPLVWSHYFALLLVPMALMRPRVGALWALPLLMWVCPPSFSVSAWQAAVAWAVSLTIFAQTLRRAGG